MWLVVGGRRTRCVTTVGACMHARVCAGRVRVRVGARVKVSVSVRLRVRVTDSGERVS